MAQASGGPEIEQLIQLLSRLPGLGPRSGRRAVLHLIKKKDQLMIPLAAALQRAVDAVKVCQSCGNIDTSSPCHICTDPNRDESGILIVVEDVADLWALERAGIGPVRYHVLGGVLSPLDGVGPDDLSIDALIGRAQDYQEIVLGVNATVEGQTTAHYSPTGLKAAASR
jgi:recombination protein RecR